MEWFDRTAQKFVRPTKNDLLQTIKAIETPYKNCRFRSRLEARWAVYFDSIGITWEYEKEGFKWPDGLLYLPDFWLPQVNMWAEVKPDEFCPDSLEKIRRLVVGTGFCCILLDGLPGMKSYYYVSPDWIDDGNLIISGACDCMISMYHHYPLHEGRFYSCVGYDRDEIPHDWFDAGGLFDDIPLAVTKALSARFEYAEKP